MMARMIADIKNASNASSKQKESNQSTWIKPTFSMQKDIDFSVLYDDNDLDRSRQKSRVYSEKFDSGVGIDDKQLTSDVAIDPEPTANGYKL